jgi:F420-non-reducing hydrogenase iron-sulfur subunit
MFEMVSELAEILGLDTRRIRLEWISSAEGNRFAEVARKFTSEIKELGPANLAVTA